MKKLMLICAPVTSRSGYGAHARDLVKAFLQHEKYDIKIMDVRWGDCPQNALKEDVSSDYHREDEEVGNRSRTYSGGSSIIAHPDIPFFEK